MRFLRATRFPLYRQSEIIYAREGIDLDRSTLAGWVGGVTRTLDLWWKHCGGVDSGHFDFYLRLLQSAPAEFSGLGHTTVWPVPADLVFPSCCRPAAERWDPPRA